MSDVPTDDNDTSTARVEDISVAMDLAPPTPAGQITPFPNVGASSVTSTSDSDLTQPSTACSSATQSMSPSVRDVPSLNQPKAQDLSNSPMEPSLQAPPEVARDTRSDVRSQPRITQTKAIGSKELPAIIY